MPRLLSTKRAETFAAKAQLISEQAESLIDCENLDTAELRISLQGLRRLVADMENLIDVPVGP